MGKIELIELSMDWTWHVREGGGLVLISCLEQVEGQTPSTEMGTLEGLVRWKRKAGTVWACSAPGASSSALLFTGISVSLSKVSQSVQAAITKLRLVNNRNVFLGPVDVGKALAFRVS